METGLGRLKDRVAVVFGAGTLGGRGAGVGNGQAAAIAYAREGARVILADISAEAAQETLQKIDAGGGVAETAVCDVRRREQVEEAIGKAVDLWGRLDILHNNVGVGEISDVLSIKDEDLLKTIDVNFVGMVRTCRAALPVMIDQGRGVITNVSAIGGMRYYEYLFSYSAAKAAVDSMTRSIASELFGRGIRCNAIVPGVIETPLAITGYAAAVGSEEKARTLLKEMSPGGKAGSPWDVAGAAVFLASDEAAYVNGAFLMVDGGAANIGGR
jgi:NAD(P)-dependent dehydrogenase (short-subunit alcohol dehydrogenase family)